ncbi:hypothetical protein ACFQ3Z_41740 [Streptomyces nogalater]
MTRLRFGPVDGPGRCSAIQGPSTQTSTTPSSSQVWRPSSTCPVTSRSTASVFSPSLASDSAARSRA